MKKLLLLSIFICAAISVTAQSDAERASMPEFSPAPYPATNYTPVVMGELPLRIDFAGEPAPLEFFDVRESLTREMLVTLYMHSRTYLMLLNKTRYFSIIEPILARNGIPDDFKYLCVAESSLDPNAVSSAGAGGLWQFMPATGKEYGLVVDKGVDERFHIEKATEAACRYLKEAYDEFGSWTLAAASYNMGKNGLRRRIDIQGGERNYYNLFLPQETLRYVYRILTFKMVCSSPESFGYVVDRSFPVLDNYTTVSVSGQKIDWVDVATRNGTTYRMLRQLNHWIRDYEYNNSRARTFEVKLPAPTFRRIPDLR